MGGTWYDSLEDYAIGKASENQQMGDLNESNTTFIYEPAGWTNGEVKVKIETKAVTEGYTLQYSTDGMNWNNYSTGSEIPMSQSGGAIYARLVDSEGNEGEVATGNVANIDKEAPKIKKEINSPSQSTSNIKLSVGVEDKASGISKIEWYYKLDTETEYTTKTEIYREMKGTEAGERTEVTKEVELSNLKAGTYNVYAIVYDVAGNFTRSPEGTSVVNVTTGKVPAGDSSINFSYSTTNWTNQNVNVTITSEVEGYALQYSKDGSKWENYTSPVPMSTNGWVFARLVDSEGNEGTVATGNVVKIDKEAPTIVTALNSQGQTTSSIDLSIEVEDDDSGFSKIEWYYKLNTASEYTEIAPEADTEMNGSLAGIKTEVTKEVTITGLAAGKTYNVYAMVYDVAGNNTRSPEETSTINVTTQELVIDIDFEPNGNAEWKKSHSVKVTASSDSGTIDSIKYKWMTKSENVSEEDFANYEVCNNGETIEKDDLTGKYYLWVNVTGDDELSNWKRSNQSYYFDNTPPEVELETEGIDGSTIKLTATVLNEEGCGEVKDYRFFIDDEEVLYVENSAFKKDTSATVDTPGKHSCAVEVTDAAGNFTRVEEDGETKLYTWNKYLVEYKEVTEVIKTGSYQSQMSQKYYASSSLTYGDDGRVKLTSPGSQKAASSKPSSGYWCATTTGWTDRIYNYSGSNFYSYKSALVEKEINRTLVDTFTSYDINAYTEGKIEETNYIIERAN